MILRVKAVLKRLQGRQESVSSNIKAGNIFIDLDRSIVKVDGKVLKLTVTEFKILTELAKNRGRVLSRDDLLDRVWGSDIYVTDRTVDTHIRRLREKMGKAAKYIETVRGFGYRFLEDDEN